MTTLERMELALCFGAVMGVMIFNIGYIIYNAVSCIKRKHKEKKARKAETENRTEE